MFNINDAHKNMIHLTRVQAQKWTKIANDEYFRRMAKSARLMEAKHFAINKANARLVGKKEAQINESK